MKTLYFIIEKIITLIISLILIFLLISLIFCLNDLNIKMEGIEEIINTLSNTLKGSWFF